MDGSLGDFLSSWAVDPFILMNLLFVLGWYGWAVHRVNRRDPGARWPVGPTVCFASGVTLLGIAYVGPMPAWSHTFFWVHMTQHLIVMMAAAPLLVLGAPVTLAFRVSGAATRRRWVVPVLRSTAVRVLTNPVLTWLVFAGVLLGTHFTGFYDWALANHDADTFIEQPLYLAAAVAFYFPLIGSNLQPRRPPHAVRLLSLALMMIPEALVGAVIYFASAILYPTFDAPRPFGLSPKADQQLSGALMWALVMVVDSFWMMVAAAEWFANEERRGRRINAQIALDEASQ